MDNTEPIEAHFSSPEDIIAFADQALKGIFPEDMLNDPVVTDVANYQSGIAYVTVQYPRRIQAALIDDNMEGITVSVGAKGIRELQFQWCEYAEDMLAYPMDITLALEKLSNDQASGPAVSAIRAELVYKPGAMGVDYKLHWRFTDAAGTAYDIAMG